MRRAHELALRGWGRTFPNPMVGAVIVAAGDVVGEGWHGEYGGLHAETVAIAGAGERARGATLHVTLEPCAHTGKQPPCADAIIAAGIARVVIAVPDPNPAAAGGADRLRAAGIVVEMASPDPAASAYNFRFLHQYADSRLPYVAVKLAVSMDAMIADANGRSQWISGTAALEWVHWLRAGFGAIAVGARTAVADDVQLTVRGRVEPRIPPVRVIFDRRGTMSPGHRVFAGNSDASVVVIVGSGVNQAARDRIEGAGAGVVVADALGPALESLAIAGIDSVLVEGGGRLAGALMRDNLVDRVYQVQAPRWLGSGIPAWPGIEPAALGDAARWRMLAVELLGDPDIDSDVVIALGRR
jgi:diaminohydroxyphosphoribosylaminopyrimidine deaminase/5-amino-6-(5-phosphoribosylamino)uracil reductase